MVCTQRIWNWVCPFYNWMIWDCRDQKEMIYDDIWWYLLFSPYKSVYLDGDNGIGWFLHKSMKVMWHLDTFGHLYTLVQWMCDHQPIMGKAPGRSREHLLQPHRWSSMRVSSLSVFFIGSWAGFLYLPAGLVFLVRSLTPHCLLMLVSCMFSSDCLISPWLMVHSHFLRIGSSLIWHCAGWCSMPLFCWTPYGGFLKLGTLESIFIHRKSFASRHRPVELHTLVN